MSDDNHCCSVAKFANHLLSVRQSILFVSSLNGVQLFCIHVSSNEKITFHALISIICFKHFIDQFCFWSFVAALSCRLQFNMNPFA